MIFRSKIKWAALGGLILSFASLVVHLIVANYSAPDLLHYSALSVFSDDINLGIGGGQVGSYKKPWRTVKALHSLQPFSNARTAYPEPLDLGNRFIYAKILGGFEKIRTSVCYFESRFFCSELFRRTAFKCYSCDSRDSRKFSLERKQVFLIPLSLEINKRSGQNIGPAVRSIQAFHIGVKLLKDNTPFLLSPCSSQFTSFSYLYNEDKFVAALKNDVIVVKSLPPKLKEARKLKQLPTFKPTHSASPSYYLDEVLPALKRAKVIGLVLMDGGCLQSTLPPNLIEYQRLRCRVAFQALRFRSEILALGHQIVGRLRAAGQPYMAYYPGLVRDTLAYHGCAELFQDVHTELIQHRRAQMIKQNFIKEKLRVNSHASKAQGLCPLMPEEVGLLLRAMGYPPRTRIYLAGSEVFGGQRVLIPLRAMYTNLVDCTTLSTKQDLINLFGTETLIPEDTLEPPPSKTDQQLKEEWNKAGPRPRPLPPPPDRAFYRHEKEGWYGWIAEKDSEPEPSQLDLRKRAHRLIFGALDYTVSVEADSFFPGFHNDGSGWPDFSSLVMGHRLYEMASLRTYRPNRKHLAKLFSNVTEHRYYPKHNWTVSIRQHLNKSLAEEGLSRELQSSKPTFFLSHPVPECSCKLSDSTEILSSVYKKIDKCPKWMDRGTVLQDKGTRGDESQEDEGETDEFQEPDKANSAAAQTVTSLEQDEEMDPDD